MDPTPHTLVPAAVRADRRAGAVVASAAGDALGAPATSSVRPLPPARRCVMTGGGGFGWAPGSGPTTPRWPWPSSPPWPARTPPRAPGGDRGRLPGLVRQRPGRRGHPDPRRCSAPPPARSTEAAAATAAAARRAGRQRLASCAPDRWPWPTPATRRGRRARAGGVGADPRRSRLRRRLRAVVGRHRPRHPPRPIDRRRGGLGLGRRGRPGLEHLPGGRRATVAEPGRGGRRPRPAPTDFPTQRLGGARLPGRARAIVHHPGARRRPPRRPPPTALEHAVRAGGDTDTVAAIAGSLLGARWGATALPFALATPPPRPRTYTEPG
jgi:hypothetical protein